MPSRALSLALLVLSLSAFTQATPIPQRGNGNGNGGVGNGNGNGNVGNGNGNVGNGNGNGNGGGNGGGNNGNNGNGNNGGNNGNGNGNLDPQESLTLDPEVIAPAFANDGQDPPVAGQVASLTSVNNFINFCLLSDLPLTNGQQITGGSCNPAPMGLIPSIDNMPSSKFVNPPNLAVLQADTQFTVEMNIANMQTGFFVNAQKNYFAAPQQLNDQGQIQGHSHVVIEKITSLQQTDPTNPRVFAFFKGLNAAAQGGKLTADVTKGLPAGVYRLSSINTSTNHAPVVGPVAQHGAFDDAIYFTITEDGNPPPEADDANDADANNAAAAADADDADAADAALNADNANVGQGNLVTQ